MSKNTTPIKVREANADFIRIMACLIVIGVHSNLLKDASDASQTLWRVLLGDGVTYFFIVMGFFVFKERPFMKTLKSVLLRVMVPAFITMLAVRWLLPWLDGQENLINCILHPAINWKEYIKAILNWSPGAGVTEYLWYVFTYMQVVLLVPVMKLVCRKNREGEKLELIRLYIIGFNLLGMILVDMMALVRIPFTAEPYKMLTIPAMYAIAGYSVYSHKDWLKNKRNIRWVAIAIALVIEILRWRLQIILLQKDAVNLNYLVWNTSFAFIVCMCVITAVLTIDFKNQKLCKVITFMGSRTFYVYLIHYPIQYYLDNRGFSDKLMQMLMDNSGYISDVKELMYIFIRVLGIFGLAMLFILATEMILKCGKRLVKGCL